MNLLHPRRRASHGVAPLASDITYSKLLRWLWISALCWLALFAAVTARAQTAAPTLVFASSVSSANGKLDTVLTWSTVPVATSCSAGGTPSTWTGVKTPSGSFVLPTITKSGTYGPTLTCSWSTAATLQLNWIPPTQNSDGTALTNLASYNIYYGKGTNPLDLTWTKILGISPSTVSWTSATLTPGVWSGVVTTFTSSGAESDNSNLASKTVVAAVQDTESIALTVNPQPNPPSNVTAK